MSPMELITLTGLVLALIVMVFIFVAAVIIVIELFIELIKALSHCF